MEVFLVTYLSLLFSEYKIYQLTQDGFISQYTYKLLNLFIKMVITTCMHMLGRVHQCFQSQLEQALELVLLM